MFVRKYTRQVSLVFTVAAIFLAGCNVGATPAPTMDVNAVSTAIVGTTVAQLSLQFTQTALAQPQPTSTLIPAETPASLLPTFALPTLEQALPTAGALPTISFNTTPVAGFTPLASPAAPAGATPADDPCTRSVFEGDVTVPDGTVFKPGADFQKIWAIRNTGTCTWDDGYTLVFFAGDKALDPYNFKFSNQKDWVSPGEGINIGINLTAPLKEGKYEGHWKMQNDQGYFFGTILSVYIEVRKK